MQDNALVILGLVGLALACVGIVTVGLLMLLRGVGSPLWTALLGGGDDEHRRMIRASPKPDLRSIAQANDFDAALARQIGQDDAEPPAAKRTTPPAEAPSPFDNATTPRLESHRTARPDVRYDDDADLFGGLLDDDGEA